MALKTALLVVRRRGNPVHEVGSESLVGSILITSARLEDWQPVLSFPSGFPAGLSDTDSIFVCPATYRCQYNHLGWSVLIEHSIAIMPGTGSLGFNLETVSNPVPEPGTLPLVAAALVVVWLAAFSGVLLTARRV
jgi:hypothetical protein